MHPINVVILGSLILGAVVVVWSFYDFYRTLSMRNALVRSLALDPEFLRKSPYIWQCDWHEQCDDLQFKKLRKIIRTHIERLGFAHPTAVLSPLDQANLMHRYRYVRSLVRAVERRVQELPS